MSTTAPHHDPLDHLTIAQVSELTKLHKDTIRRAIKAKHLHANRVGRRILIPRAAAEEWITGNGCG